MSATSRALVLVRRPDGPSLEGCFAVENRTVPTPTAGQVVVHVEWLGLDATQRGWLNDEDNYVAPVALGSVMRGAGVGTVVASARDDVPVGTVVTGDLGWQDHALMAGDGVSGVTVVPPGVEPRHMLGVYGIPGLTAYVGLTRFGRPEPGETVLVSAAAGATGSVTAQVAAAMGCRVVGVAGGAEKCRWATEVAGLDACLDHREPGLAERIRAVCPDGVDVVLDGVGGAVLDAALVNLALGARIVVVGAISTGYRGDAASPGIHQHVHLGLRRARMEGFIVLDHVDVFPEAVTRLHEWVRDGLIVVAEQVAEGLEHAPAALQGLFEGRNLGKQLVRVAHAAGCSGHP